MSYHLQSKGFKIVVAIAVCALVRFIIADSSSLCSSASAEYSSCWSTMRLHYELVDEIPGKYKRFAAFDRGEPVSVDRWIESLLSSPAHISQFVDQIREASTNYPAYFFETKGVSSKTLSKQFEFVLVNSEQLHRFVQSRGHDYDVFSEYLDHGGTSLCTSVSFLNLDRTSTLIAPRAIQPSKYMYTHLGQFMRYAPKEEVIDFWQLVLKKYNDSLDGGINRRVWLSTSGMGVAWLHMRIDNRPKYYTFHAFANEV